MTGVGFFMKNVESEEQEAAEEKKVKKAKKKKGSKGKKRAMKKKKGCEGKKRAMKKKKKKGCAGKQVCDCSLCVCKRHLAMQKRAMKKEIKGSMVEKKTEKRKASRTLYFTLPILRRRPATRGGGIWLVIFRN